MNKTKIAIVVSTVFTLFAVLFWILLPRYSEAAGIVHFLPFRGTKTMDAARQMVFDLHLQHRAEGGEGPGAGACLEAIDSNNRHIKFHVGLGKAVVDADPGAAFSTQELTRELARRIGIPTNSAPLKPR